jgi:hypothetical protein
MHNRILLHLLKSKKTIVCQNIVVKNSDERFAIFPNHIEIMGIGVLVQYTELSGQVHTLNQNGVFHFKDSNFFFI